MIHYYVEHLSFKEFYFSTERPKHDADPSPPSIAVVKNKVELYLYSS